MKADIFHAYIALLKQTKPTISSSLDPNSMEVSEESPAHQLQQQVPSVVRALHRQMREKSIKTRQGCFALLTQLMVVLPGALTDHLAALVPGIQVEGDFIYRKLNWEFKAGLSFKLPFRVCSSHSATAPPPPT